MYFRTGRDRDDDRGGYREEDMGDPQDDAVAKAFSTSYFKPRSLASYETYLSEVNYTGYLDMKEGEEGAWCRRYCVLREGELSVHKERPLFEDEEEERTSSDERVLIQLDTVASVRTAMEFGECAFQIVTPDHVFFFCAGSRQEMQEWLFAFHRSLAVIVARLVDPNSPTGKRKGVSRKAQMLKELGHGHGRTLSVTRRYRRASNYEGGSVLLPGAGGGEPLRGSYKQQDMWSPSLSQPLPGSVPNRVRSAEPPPNGMVVMPLRDAAMTTGGLVMRLQGERVEFPCSLPSPKGDLRGGGGGGAPGRRERIVKHASSSLTLISAEEEGGLDGLREGGPVLKDLLQSLEDATRDGGEGGRTLRVDVAACAAATEGLISPSQGAMVLPSPSPLSSLGGREGRESQFLSLNGEEVHSCDDGGLIFEMSLDEAEFTQLAYSASQNGSVRSSPREGPLTGSHVEVLAAAATSSSSSWRPLYSSSLSGGAVEEGMGVGVSPRGEGVVTRGQVTSGRATTTTALPESRSNGKARKRKWTTGVVSLQGIRENQEDQYVAIEDLNKHLNIDHHEAQGFFAIYDGHCGITAAEYAKNLLHVYLAQDSSFFTRPDEAMTRTCRRLDQEVLELCHREGLYCGTTAIIVLIRGEKVMVGNVGDCAAVLCRGKSAVRMSTAHTPGRTDEMQRIERANGWVTTETELFMGQLHRMDLSDPSIVQGVEKRVKWVTINRVCGELSVSRSIGDPDFKGFAAMGGGVPDFPFNFPASHSGVFFSDLIIADPEFIETELVDEDKFLLLACDGFWDVMDSQEAVDVALSFLESGLKTEEAAAKLGDMALRLGSSDNVTIVIIRLDHEEG